EIETDGEIVRVKDLVAKSEKFRTVRAFRTDTAGRWQLACFELEEIFRGDVEKNVLTVNRRVAFEPALQVRMPELQFGSIRRLGGWVGVTFPATESNEPAVRFQLRARQQTFALFGLQIGLVM